MERYDRELGWVNGSSGILDEGSGSIKGFGVDQVDAETAAASDGEIPVAKHSC